jgi:hypothetical protein
MGRTKLKGELGEASRSFSTGGPAPAPLSSRWTPMWTRARARIVRGVVPIVSSLNWDWSARQSSRDHETEPRDGATRRRGSGSSTEPWGQRNREREREGRERGRVKMAENRGSSEGAAPSTHGFGFGFARSVADPNPLQTSRPPRRTRPKRRPGGGSSGGSCPR